VVNHAIYLIASYDFVLNRLSCYIINQQQLQWTVYVVPRVATTYHITPPGSWLHWCTLNQTRAQLYFILFVSSGLDMYHRLNPLICNDRFNSQLATLAIGSYCERVEYSLTYLVLLHLMRLAIRCTLCMKKKQPTFNFWYCAL